VDHKWALNAGIDDPPKDWRVETTSRSSSTNVAAYNRKDLKQQNLGLWSARH